MSALDELIARIAELPPESRKAIEDEAAKATSDMAWVPNVGPQTQAFFCEADELLYGGQAGGGKTDLLLGLALTAHKRSLILRRINKDAVKLVERMAEILGTRDGYNGQLHCWRRGERKIDFGGCEYDSDKQRYKGDAHDLKCFDEVSDFTESQYTFIIGWNRSADPKQRCRTVAASNPPTTAEGLWIIQRWAPWLDPKHHNPAAPGELRWFTTIEGKDTEVDGPGPHIVDGKPELARSRTFIPATLSDNPDLARTNYSAVLSGMSDEYRAAYKDGDFSAGLRDDPHQCIPTSWIREAQQRWTPKPPEGVPMCAIGVDPAAGGTDETVLAPRYDGWFAPMIAVPGSKTPLGNDIAGLIVANRRDKAVIALDMGGGYGGGVYTVLIENIGRDEIVSYKGAEASTRRTADKKLPFVNKRSECYWKLREGLDPGQPGGSPIALPDDPALVADLTAPRFEVGRRGIAVEPKEDVVKRMGRSPDRGDAVVMAYSAGQTIANHQGGWPKKTGSLPKANHGHEQQRRR